MENKFNKFYRFLTLLTVLLFGIGQMWATSYIPGSRKVVTENETIEYATIAGANATTSGKWIVNPRGGTTSGKKYTNLTSDTKGNPDGIVDNIATITSNVNMATIQVPSTAKYNQSGKYVIHMRITGITGIIAHGVTGSSGRGCAIYGQEYSTSLTENTEYGSALASMTRSGNSGSFLLQYTGFTASKEYLITIAATGGDDQLYAIELIAPSCTKPGTPTSLAAGSVTHNSASLSWTAGANNDGHKIYIEKKSDKTKVLDWTDATSPYAASGLDPETTYTFKVKAKGATGYCELGDEASADFATEVDPSATTYKVTLVPAGGTISDATGWTLNAGNYEKEVSSGTELALPTFTKTNRTFKTWRKAGPTDVTSPITVTADVTLTAVWNATVEQVIYSWEGAEGGATEVGGTVSGSAENLINQLSAGYYCLKIDGNNTYSGNLVTITLSGEEKVKTGDKITYWGFYNKSSSANARPKMRDANGSNAQIFDDGTNLPNLNGGGDPAVRTFTVPAGINTNAVQLTRSQTGSNTWIPKIQIIRETQVEEGDLLTVTFNSNGGSDVAAAAVASGQAVAKPADPTRAGYRFVKWQKAGVDYNFSTAVTASFTLDAVWQQVWTVTFNANGGSEVAAAVVDNGQTVAQPADPTRGKYTFLGWFVGDTDDAYDFSAAVTAALTLKAHWQDPWTITFSDGEAAGASSLDVASITVKHNTSANAEKPADPTWEGHDFNGWFYGEPAAAFNWEANVTQDYALVAQWIAQVDKYDVEYYDGETLLGTEEQVRADQHPTAEGISTEKPLYTFVGWFTSSTLEGDPVALNTVTPVEGLKLYGKWNKAYATSYDMEAYAASEGASKAGIEAALTAANYAYTNINGIDNGHTHNYTYDGLKYKTNDGDLSFNVVAGKVVEVKTGHLPSNDAVTMYINGVANATVFEGADEEQETHKTNYFYSAVEALYRLEVLASKGTCAVKKVTIRDPYQVVFDDNGADSPVAPQYAYPSVTLPTPTKGTQSLLGWFDDATAGNKIGDAGASYTPTANITLYAHWEAISTDNTLSDLKVGGVTVDGFSPTVHTYYVVLPYGTAVGDIPAISATANSAKAKQVAIQQAVWAGDPYNCYRAQANVQAEDESWGYYDVRFSFAPKDGVSIIKVATTGGTNKTVTGLYAGDGDVNLSSNKKMDNGKYIGFVLDGTTLQAGDKINVHTTTAANTVGSHIIFYDNMTDKNELYETGEIGGTGDNIFTINAAMEGKTTAYVYRANNDAAHQWNGYVDYIEVTRAMDPVLTAISFDGVDAEPGVGNTFSALLPNGTNLGTMTVTPTIVWNGAGSAEPTAAWAWGANTYVVTDKDGDASTYTITLTEDVLKHTVSFNTHGGSAVASEEVEHNAYLAAAPADPTKEDYIFQYWSLSDGGEEVDVTTVQIDEDKEFHAVWVADGAIKLLDGSTVNTTNFITGVTANETVEFKGNTVNYAKFSGTVSSVSGVKDLTRVIAYNATTTQTKIQISAHNNSTSARNILVKGVVEGSTDVEDLATIALSNKEDKVSDWITFDNAANRTIYIFVGSSAGDVYFTQVKVVESGDALKQFGEVGYAINLNKGRLFGPKETDLAFEGATFNLSGDYQPTNTGCAKIKSSSISFTVASPVLMTVTTSNNKTYYVTEGAAGTDNETAATGATEFNLTTGTWYITGESANDVQITNIAFSAPKCAEPTIDAQPVTNVTFGAGNLTASVTAHVNDGGTLSYQWYNASDDSEVTGADEATLTTTTEGTYYVIVTNTLTDHQDNSIKSDEATLGYRTLNDATLSALSYGDPETAIALEADKYEYRVILSEGTTEVPALHATATMNPYPTVTITNAASFTDYNAQSTVHVLAEDGLTELTYTVNFVVKHIYTALEDVTESTTWNWTGSVNQSIDDVPNKGVIIANYIEGDNFEKIEGKAGEYARRNQNGGVYQGTYLHFNTTVPGRVKFYFRAPSDGENCTITVKNGGRTVVAGTRGNSFGWSDEVFVNGDVVVEMVNDKEGGGTTRVQQVVFTAATPDYTRDVRQGYYGTICLPQAGVMVGASIFELAYYSESENKIFMDRVMSGEMVAGRPYIFLPYEGVSTLGVYYTDEATVAAGDYRGLYGYYDGTDNSMELEPGDGHYILYQNQFREVTDSYVYIDQNRAYFKIGVSGGIPTNVVAPLPGRMRMAIGAAAPKTPTGIEEITNDQLPMNNKVLINGQLFILRGEKMYDATGRLVK